MREADRAADLDHAGGDERRHPRLHLRASMSRQPRRVAHLSAVTERAQRASERTGRWLEAREPKQHGIGDASRHDRADVGRVLRGRIEAARRGLGEQFADQERVATSHPRHGWMNRPWARSDNERADQRADGPLRQR